MNLFWERLKSSLWFLPGLLSSAGFIVSISLINLDYRLMGKLPDWVDTTPDAGRAVLGGIVAGLVTVTGLVVSMTMMALSQVSSQYGPRVIRKVFEQNVPQLTIGTILGVLVLCMVALRSIRDNSDGRTEFVPSITIATAEIGSGICIVGLLAFTTRIALCLRADSLIRDLYEQLTKKILAIEENAHYISTDLHSTRPVFSRKSGYLRRIDLQNLVSYLRATKSKLKLFVRPGDFVYQGRSVGELLFEFPPAEIDDDKLQQALVLDQYRQATSDLESSILDMVEIAVRALSPGINDPRTAENVVDYLSDALARLADRGLANYAEGCVNGGNEIAPRITKFGGVLNTAFNQIRQASSNNVTVYCRLLEGLNAIYDLAVRGEDKQEIVNYCVLVTEDAKRSIPNKHDLQDVLQRALFADQLHQEEL